MATKQKATKYPRIFVHIQHDGIEWYVRCEHSDDTSFRLRDKALLVENVSARLSVNWSAFGIPAELIIHNRDGQIGAGSSSRRTYGNDPKRTKG